MPYLGEIKAIVSFKPAARRANLRHFWISTGKSETRMNRRSTNRPDVFRVVRKLHEIETFRIQFER